MDVDPERLKEMMLFQINRNIINLYKRYLNILEDIRKDHASLLLKVQDKTSKEYAESIDYFDAKKYKYYRKKVLDLGNEVFRDIEKSLEYLEIKIK
jgi:3-methyladenine DNA glycosylase AlkC